MDEINPNTKLIYEQINDLKVKIQAIVQGISTNDPTFCNPYIILKGGFVATKSIVLCEQYIKEIHQLHALLLDL